jgi:hypothetical protein
VAAARLELGRERVDHRGPVALEAREPLALRGEESLDGDLGPDRRVLHLGARASRRQALLDERPQHVVDALAGDTRLARDLGGREGVAADQRGVRPALIGRQAEPGQAGDEAAAIHPARSWRTTTSGVNGDTPTPARHPPPGHRAGPRGARSAVAPSPRLSSPRLPSGGGAPTTAGRRRHRGGRPRLRRRA